MSSRWYFTKNGVQQGPVDSKTLKELAASGGLTPEDHVWKEGMADWKEAGRLRGVTFHEERSAAVPNMPPRRPQPPNPDGPEFTDAVKELFAATIGRVVEVGKEAVQATNDWQKQQERLAGARADSVETGVPEPTPEAMVAPVLAMAKSLSSVGCLSLGSRNPSILKCALAISCLCVVALLCICGGIPAIIRTLASPPQSYTSPTSDAGYEMTQEAIPSPISKALDEGQVVYELRGFHSSDSAEETSEYLILKDDTLVSVVETQKANSFFIETFVGRTRLRPGEHAYLWIQTRDGECRGTNQYSTPRTTGTWAWGLDTEPTVWTLTYESKVLTSNDATVEHKRTVRIDFQTKDGYRSERRRVVGQWDMTGTRRMVFKGEQAKRLERNGHSDLIDKTKSLSGRGTVYVLSP